MNRPMLKLPHNTDELLHERKEAVDRISVIARREKDLKQEYTVRSMALQDRIKKLNAELNKFQRENRSARRKLAEERLRLTKDLTTLKQRYAGMISRTRKKVSEYPEEAFRLMEALK